MKIKFPNIFAVKRKKLHATIARKPLRIGASAEYDEMAEPNMKLSRALLIVLVLHVVAVSGIIAFNVIKTRQNSAPEPAANSSAVARPSVGKSEAAVPHAAANQREVPRHEETKSARVTSRQTGKEERPADRAKGGATSSTESGKVYFVAKGDNPVTIAKKLKVSYDELLALNHIEDPRKLQIGQKLLIPAKATKAKKTDE